MRKGIRYNSGLIFNLEHSMTALHAKFDTLYSTTAMLCKSVDIVASGFARSKMTLQDVLPFETNDDVNAFCVKDGRQDERREALIELLRVKGDPSSITKYVYSLSRTVFDPEYLATHRWPSERYDNLTISFS